MLRVAIIGCGKIADQHVLALQRVADCQCVAVCDRELLMAQQLGERFGIGGRYSDVKEMLKSASPDVVHITTPPQSHYSLAMQCLKAGKHVYLEKPFTVTADEAEELLEFAESQRLKMTAGHNYQFTLEMLEMRRLVAAGFLGGKPVHVESHYSYSLADPTYVGPILGSRTHWVRMLPGQLLHNLISHGLAKLVEFLDEGPFEIVATGTQSQQLQALGGQEVLDELRVMLRDNSGTTAYFCFSTQIKPGLSQLRVCGPANSLVVDHVSGCLIRHPNKSFKSYMTYFAPPLLQAREHFRNAKLNVTNFLNKRLYQDSGMKELIERFYANIRAGAPPPIAYREILSTARIMDEIFAQIYASKETGQPQAVVPALS
jgi:predicted dehydrogenase